MNRALLRAVCAGAVAACAFGTRASPVIYTPISMPGDFNPELYQWTGPGCLADTPALTGNGTTTDGTRAFRWTPTEGLRNLGALPIGQPPPNGRYVSMGYGISRDGERVVGLSTNIAGGAPSAFLWSPATGMTDLHAPYGSVATGISGNGQVVFGTPSSAVDGWVWSNSTGFRTLEHLPAASAGAMASSASFDGSFVAGSSADANNVTRAVRWTGASGPTVIPCPGNANVNAGAVAISDNGDAIGGVYYPTSNYEPHSFLWSASTNTSVDLGIPLGATGLTLLDMSRNATVAVLQAQAMSDVAYIWSTSDGLQSAELYFTSHGVDLTGWSSIDRVWSVSPDGLKFAGYGTLQTGGVGTPTTFVINMVPSPGSSALLALAGVVAARRRR